MAKLTHITGGKSVSVLLIDIGNTRAKYCLADKYGPGEEAVVDSPDALLNNIGSLDAAYISSVKHPERAKAFAQALTTICPVTIAKSEKYALIAGEILQNSYTNVANMGVDRWLAMCAGMYLAQLCENDSFLVVDAGTAITCDAVVKGQHQGGLIAPGLHQLQEILLQNTDRVFAPEDWPSHIQLGQDTDECVGNGCLAQLQGLVEVARAQIAQYSEQYLLILSGGDGYRLLNTQHRPKKHLQNAVLLGLWTRFVHKL